jgi:hypothetical protein
MEKMVTFSTINAANTWRLLLFRGDSSAMASRPRMIARLYGNGWVKERTAVA